MFDLMPLAEITQGSLRTTLLGLGVVPPLLCLGWFGMMLQRQVHGTPRYMKWIALPVLVFTSIFVYVRHVSRLSDPLYNTFGNIGDGMQRLHWVAFAGPLVLCVGLALWGIIHDRREALDM